MNNAIRNLLMGRKRTYRTSTFGAWTPVVGAAADGVASALGDWLGNLVRDPGFEAADADTSWFDASSIGGTYTVNTEDVHGGVQALQMTHATSIAYVYQLVAVMAGASYAYRRWLKNLNGTAGAPLYDSANALWLIGTEYVQYPSWTQLQDTVAMAADCTLVRVYGRASTTSTALIDDYALYRQNAPLLSPHRAASGVWTWAVAQPASGVVPWSALVRYADASNYWEVRTAPNTAGNDLELVEVVAGVETTRAAADVDWTAGETDELRITAQGTTIGVEHRKHGETVWTAGLSYASATTHQTATRYGQMQWGVGEKRATSVRWDR